jgi:hypothetical protein
MPGFKRPTTTPTPDDLFDEWLSVLSFAELKVLLYIIRRTFGFKKDSDAISLRQITEGITTKDGRVLDRGTGLSRKATFQAVQSLEERGLLVVSRTVAGDGVNQINIYSLVFSDDGVGTSGTHGGHHEVGTSGTYGSNHRYPPVGTSGTPQQTDSQETVKQQTDQDPSRPRQTSIRKKQVYDEARLTLIEYVSDLSSEFIDTASIEASTTRTVNLYRKSGLSLEAFIDIMTEARAITKERMASIKKKTREGDKSKMAYFFAVLEDRLGLEQQNGHPS